MTEQDKVADEMAGKVATTFLSKSAKQTRPRIRCVKCRRLHRHIDKWHVICDECSKRPID